MKRIELLAPAGDLERLKYAVMYGADAVYIGGKKFSLRSMASNFELEDIEEGCLFAHQHNAKVYVTCNMIMHENDTMGILTYIKELERVGIDGIIASSLAIIAMIKKNTRMEAHLSTQLSVSNSESINFLKNKYNIDRVVLARECSLADIETISKNTDVELEVFIEGAMCSSISGRCMMSNVLTNRDANRGGCAQPCRWNYNLYEGDNKISLNDYEFSLASKDLSGIEMIPSLIESGIASLKIEGRMKSLHYIATIVNAYRRCIDDYYAHGVIDDFSSYKDNLKHGQNRQIATGFFEHEITNNEVIYDNKNSQAHHDFVGIVLDFEERTGKATIEQRNVFEGNRDIEILTPLREPFIIKIGDIYNENGDILDSARQPGTKISFYVPKGVVLKRFDLIR